MAEVIEQGTHVPDNLIGGDKKLVTEEVLIPTGNNLVRGTVLGRVKASVPTTGTADGGNTGNGTCTAVSGGKDIKQGTYTVECVRAVTNGGDFEITGPAGEFVGRVQITAGAGGTGVFASDEINLTLTDGATDFALADKFTIAVTEGVPNTGTAGGGNTGNGTMTNVEGRRRLKVGTYTLTCITAVAHGGVFSVVDPDSIALPNATMTPGAGGTTNFENDQIAFSLTDGSTDFIVGDTFTVAVTIAPRQCVALDKTAGDGSSVPYGVLAEALDATSAAKTGIAYLEGQFNERSLVFASGTDIEDVRDAMRDVGLIPVPSVVGGDE